MGASGGGYRCRVAEIRDATPDDFDAVFELLERLGFVIDQRPGIWAKTL
jgi:hypothetical protein